MFEVLVFVMRFQNRSIHRNSVSQAGSKTLLLKVAYGRSFHWIVMAPDIHSKPGNQKT
jgi:hypothetical protein